MSKTNTVWKAQWPLSGEPFCLIYDADTRERQSMVPATPKLWKEVFQEKYTKVFFEGHVEANGVVAVDRFVRQPQWAEDPTQVKPSLIGPVLPPHWEVVSRDVINHKEN